MIEIGYICLPATHMTELRVKRTTKIYFGARAYRLVTSLIAESVSSTVLIKIGLSVYVE